jgi:hypothetical protein
MEVLQTSALPLGYVAVMPILAYSCRAVKVLILDTLHAMMMSSKIALCVEIVSPHIASDVGLCVLSCHNGVAEKGSHR